MKCCILCGKEITYNDNYTSFGSDGDFVHYNCLKSKDKYFTAIDNMNDNEFEKFMTGKKELDVYGTN